MKLKTHEEKETIRIGLIKKGEKSESLTLEETTIEEVNKFVKLTLYEAKVNPIYEGRPASTSVQIRKYIGGKSIEASINFRVFFWNPTAISKILKSELINLSNK